MDILRRLSALCLIGLLAVAPAAQAVHGGFGFTPSSQAIASGAPRTGARLRAAARDEGSVRVIVEFDGASVARSSGLESIMPQGATATSAANILSADLSRLNAAQQRQRVHLVARAKDAFIRSIANQGRMTNVRGMTFTPAVSMSVDAAALQALERNPNVTRVYEDVVHAPALAESTEFIHAPNAWAANYTGAGQTVAILDTGVDKSHPMLSGKVVSEACYSQNLCPDGATSSTAPGSGVNCSTSITEACGHGTHVAAIAAGKDPGGTGLNGVAKDANIIAIQVFTQFDSTVGAYTSDIVRGLERVYELRNTYNIASVNLSLGGSTLYTSYCDTTGYKDAIDQLRSAGIATVIAAGNSGSTTGISSPACTSSAISVGATLDNADTVSSYSNIASFLSLVAPGSNITSAFPDDQTRTWSGTSMATPHVTGAWAVRKQQAPDESVTDTLAYFRDNAVTMDDTRSGATVTGLKRLDFPASTEPEPSEYQLSVNKTGGGTVTSSPAGIDCGTTCSAVYAENVQVTLTATPDADATFDGWSGACSGDGACTVTMIQNQSVGASFSTASTDDHGDSIDTATGVDLDSDTSGVINAAGDNDYFRFTVIESGTLTLYTTGATDTVGALLDGSGATVGSDDNSGDDSNFSIVSPVSPGTYYAQVRHASADGTGPYVLAVRFAAASATAAVRVSTSGSGTVTSTPAGIDCGTTCEADFTIGASVTLQATPAAGYEFYRWDGGCTDTSATCTLTVSADGSTYAIAYFRQIPQVSLSVYKRGGSGTVTSSPDGIDCGSTCRADFAQNTSVTLTAEPASGYTFRRWGGYCTGNGTSCTLGMSYSMYAYAYFQRQPAADDHGDGIDSATPVAVPSDTDGVIDYAGDNDYFRIVVPSAGDLMVNTTGSTDTYGYLLNSDGSAIAHNDDGGDAYNFRIQRYVGAGTYHVRVRHYSGSGTGAYTLQVSLQPVTDHLYVYQSGSGRVISSPAGIDCTASVCFASFNRGSTVTLTASPASGYAFSRWAGSCGGTTDTCAVSMSGGTRSVRAYYIPASSGTPDDHGDSIATATPIGMDSWVQGSIERGGDNDYVRVTLTSRARLEAFTSGSTDTFGYLYDARGQLLSYDDDGGSGLNFRLRSGRLNPGDYFVRVRHYSPGGTGAYGLYVRQR